MVQRCTSPVGFWPTAIKPHANNDLEALTMWFKRSQKWPLWARKAFAPVIAKRRAQAKQKQDLEAKGSEAGGLSRTLLREAHHGMADDEEDVPLTTPRDMEMGEGEEGEPMEGPKAVDDATSYRELMEYSAANKKDRDADEEVMPIPGNMYRWWGLGIMTNPKSIQNMGLLCIVAAQAFAPPACIFNNLYRMDWTHWSFGVADWDPRAPSSFSKHVVATIFLFMFTLNGLMVIKQERIASMKISAMLERKQEVEPEYNKDVNYCWLITGRIMNCVVVLECCAITYFSFVLSDTPMDVLFNAMAVTFLYNLDDIGGEMGFLGDEDWDGEELGKLYYWEVFDMMIDLDLPGMEDKTPYDIHEIPHMRARFTHWSYKIAEPVLALMTIVLPLMYIFIDNLHCKPEGVKLKVIGLEEQVKELMEKMG